MNKSQFRIFYRRDASILRKGPKGYNPLLATLTWAVVPMSKLVWFIHLFLSNLLRLQCTNQTSLIQTNTFYYMSHAVYILTITWAVVPVSNLLCTNLHIDKETKIFTWAVVLMGHIELLYHYMQVTSLLLDNVNFLRLNLYMTLELTLSSVTLLLHKITSRKGATYYKLIMHVTLILYLADHKGPSTASLMVSNSRNCMRNDQIFLNMSLLFEPIWRLKT